MSRKNTYIDIQPAGSDTGTTLNLSKRVNLIAKHAGTLGGKRILDAWCGGGAFVKKLLDSGANAYGVDFSDQKVQGFKRHHPKDAERVRQGDIERLAFEDQCFDIVLLNEVLEHVPDDRKALAEAYRVLKQNGSLFLFSPNRIYPFETHRVSLKNRDDPIPMFVPFIPYIPIAFGQKVFHYYARNYWPGELRKLVRRAGFNITYTGYVWQTFENISGSQPKVVRIISPVLRKLFGICEAIPFVRALGVSQLIIAKTVPRSG
jgi:ubiquinone/menaquinone biosynthesis C-methylase UbiE